MSEEFRPFGMEDYTRVENPLDTQVGGAHYKGCGMQPIELSEGVRMFPSTSSVLRYIVRHKEKNGKQDLLKIFHYCDFIEKYNNWYFGFGEEARIGLTKEADRLFYKFINSNPQLDNNQIQVILGIQYKDLEAIRTYTLKEIEEIYPESLVGM